MRNRRTLPQRHAPRSGHVALVSLAALLVGVASPTAARAAENLELVPEVPMLVLLVAMFAALVFPLNALIFRPIFRALDERASRIEGARQRAEHIGLEADAVLAQYETSIREARAEAEAARKEMVTSARSEQASIASAARSEAEALVDKARRDLDGELGEARASLRTASEELGRLAAEQILGRSL
jgi:F-type H+-transporting ATPase subunit b